jgi:hypothetical protein
MLNKTQQVLNKIQQVFNKIQQHPTKKRKEKKSKVNNTVDTTVSMSDAEHPTCVRE